MAGSVYNSANKRRHAQQLEHFAQELMHVSDVELRFNELKWHDSKLIGFVIHPDQVTSLDQVTLDLELYAESQSGGFTQRKVALSFNECRYVRLAIDLESNRLCSDDISEAFCEKDSDLKRQIEERIFEEPYQVRPEKERPLTDYYVFRIKLIPPGGEMVIIAKGFNLVMLE